MFELVYLYLFNLEAVTYTGLVTKSYFLFTDKNFRFLVPVSMIICCDIMSYVFGFFFGRTPLIKLSPKKTWEGFIGGGISTVVFGVIVSFLIIKGLLFLFSTTFF